MQEIYPGQFEPSIAHKFVRLIETHRKLLRNYTQNIDTLEQVAHIERVIQCHGEYTEHRHLRTGGSFRESHTVSW